MDSNILIYIKNEITWDQHLLLSKQILTRYWVDLLTLIGLLKIDKDKGMEIHSYFF